MQGTIITRYLESIVIADEKSKLSYPLLTVTDMERGPGHPFFVKIFIVKIFTLRNLIFLMQLAPLFFNYIMNYENSQF